MELYSLNNIKQMEVIEVSGGKRLGFVKDLKIDCNNYKIIALLVPCDKQIMFNKGSLIEVPWSKIKLIGEDVILVDYKELYSLENGVKNQ